MGNYKAIPGKRRRDELTVKCEKLFSQAIQENDFHKASLIVLYNVLKNYGVKIILTALHDGNSFYKRKSLRRGL